MTAMSMQHQSAEQRMLILIDFDRSPSRAEMNLIEKLLP